MNQLQQPTIGPFDPGKTEVAASVLARAFQIDSGMMDLVPNEEEHRQVLKAMIDFSVNYFLRFGRIDSTPDAVGVDMWLAPGNTEMTPVQMLRESVPATRPQSRRQPS